MILGMAIGAALWSGLIASAVVGHAVNWWVLFALAVCVFLLALLAFNDRWDDEGDEAEEDGD